MRFFTFMIGAALLFAGALPAADCASAGAEWKGTPTWRLGAGGAYFYSTKRIAIDADGSPNAYHPENKGIDDLKNAGYPNGGWRSILATDPRDNTRPYVQTDGEFKGYFVSMTSLSNPNPAVPKTDPRKWVDARTVPYMVIPGGMRKMAGTGDVGDLAVALNLTTGDRSEAIIADIGPSSAQVGEISIGLAERLGGHNVNARNGRGAPTGPFLYVIFAGSRKQAKWPLTPQQLRDEAAARLNELGGWDAVRACAAAVAGK